MSPRMRMEIVHSVAAHVAAPSSTRRIIVERGADDEMETTSNAEQQEPRCWLVWVNCLLPDKPWRAHGWPLARRRPGSYSQMAGSVHQSCWTPSLMTLPITCHQPRLDERRFYKNMRSAKRGAAGGASGMTREQLQPLLDSPKDVKLFFKMAESLARAEVPDAVTQTIRMGRMTAFRKPSGGVRGIVAGDQCVAHVLEGLCELDGHCTVTSIDGISAYDLVSRAAMLDGLLNRVGGEALPFVRMFCGSPSLHMWEDADGVEHTIRQGEGGEQGDALNRSFVWVSIQHLKQCRTKCVRESSCSHIWTISTLSPARSEWEQCIRLFVNTCSLSPGLESMVGRLKCGTEVG